MSEEMTDVSQKPPALEKWWLLGLILIVIAVLAARVRLLELPLERDEGEYAYGAQLLLHGGRLYDDLHTMKWPGMFAAYALIFSLAGETVAAIHGGLIVINLLTAIGMYLLSRLILDRASSLIVAVSFLVLSVLPVMHGIVANAEHFALLFPVFGLWCLIHSLRDRSWFLLLVAGMLMGLGSVMKQHAHAFVLLGGILSLITPWPSTGRSIGRNIGQAAVYSLGVFITWGGMCLAVWQRGDWEKFITWTIHYPRDYTQQIPWSGALGNFWYTASLIFPVTWPLMLLALVGLVSVNLQKNRKRTLLATGFFLAGLISICPGFYFREHYFLMLMPSIALLCGLGAESLKHHFSKRDSTAATSLTGMICLVALSLPLFMQGNLLFGLNADRVSRSLYGPNPFVESPKIAAYLKENMSETDRMVIFGSEPQIAFYSQRRSATGDIYMYPMTEIHPLARKLQDEMIQKVTQARPKFALYVSARTSWLIRPETDLHLIYWMNEFLANYELVGLAETVSFTESKYQFAAPNETLHRSIGHIPKETSYVAVFRRRDLP